MLLKKVCVIVICLSIVISFTACSGFQKVLKSSDYELKYTKAVEFYEDGDYVKAQQLFEELIPILKGSVKGEEVYFYYAYSFYGQENFIMAGYHFRNFYKTYPTSKHTEECEFQSAYCHYRDSPDPSLDQTFTIRAIDALQLFINKYPNSERAEKCNELIDKLRDKLEVKSYNASKLYFDIGDYKAAIVALKNALIDYPDTKYREDILYLIVRSSFKLAENSIETKKNERYESTITEYYTLIDKYPETKHMKDATRVYENAKKELESSN